ncbi:hypothetical protein V6N13_125050 [Hibiscus sabdariffa]
MRLLSCNIRGLGTSLKKRTLKDLLRRHRCDTVFVQETKLMVLDCVTVSHIWYIDGFDFVFVPSVGNSGGLLIVWELIKFQMVSHISHSRFLMLHGKWLDTS